MQTEPELTADYACMVGENPLWHPTEQCLYWVEILAGKLFRYNPALGMHEQCYEAGEAIGGFTIQADGRLLLFMARGAVRIWDDGKLSTVVEEIPIERASRFNDVIADPAGRVFCGTMPTGSEPGRLYRLDTDGAITELLDGIKCSNGLGFTPDRKQMYYTDSHGHVIYIFDYDQATGAITNRRVFASVPEGEGVPDGMTVDAEGYIWSARWGGSCLVRYSPDGVEVARIRFPVRKVSSVIFGGPDYTDMYITTAIGDDGPPDESPHAGALFHLNLGIRGLPEFYSRVALA